MCRERYAKGASLERFQYPSILFSIGLNYDKVFKMRIPASLHLSVIHVKDWR